MQSNQSFAILKLCMLIISGPINFQYIVQPYAEHLFGAFIYPALYACLTVTWTYKSTLSTRLISTSCINVWSCQATRFIPLFHCCKCSHLAASRSSSFLYSPGQKIIKKIEKEKKTGQISRPGIPNTVHNAKCLSFGGR